MKIESVDIDTSKKIETLQIPIMESFSTLQGEGFHTGKASWFIRTGGCDVGCHWCDVKESWDANAHPSKTVKEIVDDVKTANAEIVIITGGEPLMYDMDILTSAIRDSDKKVHVETSGTHKLTGSWDWICFSPKKFKSPLPEFYQESHELKVVIYHPSDIEWAEEHARKMHPNARLYMQPEWSRKEKVLPIIIDYIRNNPHWRLSLQTHKYLDIP